MQTPLSYNQALMAPRGILSGANTVIIGQRPMGYLATLVPWESQVTTLVLVRARHEDTLSTYETGQDIDWWRGSIRIKSCQQQ